MTRAVHPFICNPCKMLWVKAPAFGRRRKFPIYISQDGLHGPVHQVASELARKHRSFVKHLVHKQAPPVREDRDRSVSACFARRDHTAFGKSEQILAGDWSIRASWCHAEHLQTCCRARHTCAAPSHRCFHSIASICSLSHLPLGSNN